MMDYRDVIIHPISDHLTYITGCDSCGAIGMKDADVLQVPEEVVGMVTARVALLEVLTLGAQVVGVTVPISCEPEPTGNKILSGVHACLRTFNLEVPVLTSMEKNMKTTMTALGVVVNGICKNLKMSPFEAGDEIYVVGRPAVGQEVMDYAHELLNVQAVEKLLASESVKEILPVGSQGIEGELSKMFSQRSCGFALEKDLKVDVKKSCGPSSVAIVVAKDGKGLDFDIPLNRIGSVV